jgi:hypothetical protein
MDTIWKKTNIIDGINCISSNNSNIYAGSGNKIYISSDNGNSWSTFVFDSSNININCFDVYGKYIFAGTNYGVYLSKDDGTSWSEMNKGIEYEDILCLVHDDKYIYSATGGFGVFRAKLSDFGITSVEDSPSSTRELAPLLYPNPVHDKLNIHISNETTTQTQIQIFDVFGQQVAGSSIPVGSLDKTINMESFPVGTYLLKVGDRVEKIVKTG